MDSTYFNNQVENAKNHLNSIIEHPLYEGLKDEVKEEIDRVIVQIDGLSGVLDKPQKRRKKPTKKGKKRS